MGRRRREKLERVEMWTKGKDELHGEEIVVMEGLGKTEREERR